MRDDALGNLGDLDDTIIRLVEPVLRPARTGAIELQPAPDPIAQWCVRVRGTSTVVPLDRPVDVGRRPGLSRIDENPAPRRLVVADPQGLISARHARVEQVGETLVVHDLGSTNGVVVHWATGASRRLGRGESIAVLSNAVIALAEGVELDFVAQSVPTGGSALPLPRTHPSTTRSPS